MERRQAAANRAHSSAERKLSLLFPALLFQPPNFDVSRQRYPLRSYGAGLRLNLFNYAILRWDYAVPIDQAGHKGVWTWSLWPSF